MEGNMLVITTGYFRAHQDYFWQWAEKGAVIEWKDGQTICYREDLLPILEKLSPEGLPPVGAILLILAACKEGWKAVSAGKQGLLYGLVQLVEYQDKGSRPDMVLRESVKSAALLLDVIAALPAEYRTGTKRAALLYTLFREEADRLEPHMSKELIYMFNRGILDGMIFKPGIFPAGGTFVAEMGILSRIQKLFPDAGVLEMKVRVGLGEIPEPAPMSLQRQGTGDFLEQLEQDERLAGLVRLTRKLIAALNIPLHTHGSSDRLLGGVSDIANRGSFDRLLISELANDDDALMARLANNEALFLRREDLPSDPDRERILLIDTTLKMWGTPRVFALAAALACTCNARPGMKTNAYVLGGEEWQEADLRSKEGLIKALEKLDGALDCRTSLQAFLRSDAASGHPEVYLITEDACLHDMYFQAAMAEGKVPMTGCISVERSGQMRFYEMSNGHRKMTSEARFEMESLLRTAPARVQRQADIPAVLQASSFPLYFPAHKLQFDQEHCFAPGGQKAFCITKDRRLLYWEDKSHGARELTHALRIGKHCWGFDGSGKVFLVVYNGGNLWLYQINMLTGVLSNAEVAAVNGIAISKIVFSKGRFYMQTVIKVFTLDPKSGRAFAVDNMENIFIEVLNSGTPYGYYDLKRAVRKIVNNGYTIWTSIDNVFINRQGQLCMGPRYLEYSEKDDKLSIESHAEKSVHKFVRTDSPKWMPDSSLVFQRFISKDGSEVIVDPRGFLHLRSSDVTLPEVTLALVIGKTTAAWASDGKMCGSPYFTGLASKGDIKSFYYHYIQRFIDIILRGAAVH